MDVTPETGAELSAGGFSNYFEAPSYQMAAVQGYLTLFGDKEDGRFNKSGRAYPDVSAQGFRLRVLLFLSSLRFPFLSFPFLSLSLEVS